MNITEDDLLTGAERVGIDAFQIHQLIDWLTLNKMLEPQQLLNKDDVSRRSEQLERTPQNAQKYEAQIGLAKLKEEQRNIYRNSNGKKGKYWMALSPKWIDSDEWKKKLGTEFEIAYWVNYGDDDVYGWFSVEQIKQWLSNPDLKLKTLGGTGSR